jgi:hypothetical protein
MKFLITAILVGTCGVCYADQASESFATGFANALAQRQAQQSEYKTYPTVYFDVIDNSGNTAGYKFASLTQCQRYVQNSQLYLDCVLVRE